MLHPEEAISYIDKLHRAGQKLRQERAHREAIPYLHCAYEVSSLLLERQIEQYPQIVLQFTGTALSLAEALNKGGMNIRPSELMIEAYSKLEECSADMEITPFVPQYVEQCLNALQNGAEYFKHTLHPTSSSVNTRIHVH
jgi:hypothetical protein